MKPVQAVTLGTIYRSMVHVIPNAGQDSFQILMEYAKNAFIHAKAAMVLDLTNALPIIVMINLSLHQTNVLIAAHMDSTAKMTPTGVPRPIFPAHLVLVKE